MNEFIEKLRAKPEMVRRQIVVWTAAVITVIIFLAWLASLAPRSQPAPETKAVMAAEKTPGPVVVFFNFGKVLYEKVR